MTDLQQRLDDLRREIQALDDGDPQQIAPLERKARTLLSDAKNTPHEAAAQALFGELARLGNPTSPTAATVRGYLRRARIRLEIAGDDEDIDEAIDILADALALDPGNMEVVSLLQDAGRRNPQAAQRVNDLFSRYGVEIPSSPPPAAPPPPSEPTDTRRTTSVYPASTTYPTSAGYPAPEKELYQESSPRRSTSTGTFFPAGEIDDALSELTQYYYSGDYQQVIDLANRILSQQPGNPTALEYRQKAEDNIIRGVVPDHRIPFDARVSYNRANSLVRAGNYDEAERLYREARDLAERAGILSWKDAEQALLDIQDLALARELLNEGDRLMATDNWSEALRKYEGALRVVPNDPQAEERIEKVRRVQSDADQAAVQLTMLSGSLGDQATQLQNILAILARLRQLLPNSQRLAQLTQEANTRLTGIKAQLNDMAESALMRANNASSVEERLSLTNEALQLLELSAKFDPGDTSVSDRLMEARASASDMQRARQVIERAAALIAQNFDNELVQARGMLAGLRDYAQDARYRAVVSDLLMRFVERSVAALDAGDVAEAETWLDLMRDEPFHILGRRAEVARIEQNVRAAKQRSRLRLGLIGIIIIFIGGVGLLGTRPVWEPIINPPPTHTPTPTFTPSDTPTPTATFTPSDTPTPTNTPTYTLTPSHTVTPSETPTETPTPTHTLTPTATFTPSDTPTITPTPTATATLVVQCHIYVGQLEGVNVRSRPTANSALVGYLPAGTAADVLAVEANPEDGTQWYRISSNIEGAVLQGWIRSNLVVQIDQCPSLNG